MNDRRKRKEKKRLTIRKHDRPITCITHSIIHAMTVFIGRAITEYKYVGNWNGSDEKLLALK